MKKCRLKNPYFIIKPISFIGIFLLLLLIVNQVLLPKWYYPNKIVLEPTGRTISGFYQESPDSIDVITLGTSHMAYGFSPMEIYEEFRIKSYNLATSVQPIQASYFLLKEVLKYQSPKTVCLDVSSLFLSVWDASKWRFISDQMPLSVNKSEYAKLLGQRLESESYFGTMFPIYRYHERWKELTKEDFTDFYRNTHFFNKGYYMCSAQISSGITIESMNKITNYMLDQNEMHVQEYILGKYQEDIQELPLYQVEIPENNLDWLLKIKKLCDDSNTELLLVKIPTVQSPVINESAWTKERYQYMRELSQKYQLNFLDLLYEIDCNIDWEHDTPDGGNHLNLLGSQKVSHCLGDYLTEYYHLNTVSDPNWDQDYTTYEKMKKIALLQLEDNLSSYLQMLKEYPNDKAIFIVAEDNMAQHFLEQGTSLMRQWGSQLQFKGTTNCAFVTVIENGQIVYEAISDRQLRYSNELATGQEYSIESYGQYINSSANITIDKKNYTPSGNGIKIVVYDTKRNMILDSVSFDEYNKGHRIFDNSIEYLRALENYLIEVEDR